MQVSQIGVDKLTQAETMVAGTADIARDTLHTAAQVTDVSRLLNPLTATSQAMEIGASGAQTVSTAAHAIADGVRASFPMLLSKGAQGSVISFYNQPYLEQVYFWLVDEDFQYNGRPLCKVNTLSTGFHVVKDGHIRIPGLEGEAAAIKAYLESGIEVEVPL